jgi:hypothetical protein
MRIIAAVIFLGLLSAPTLAQAQYYGPSYGYTAEPSNPYYGQPNNAPSYAQPYQQPPLPPLPRVPNVNSYIPAPSQGPTGYPCTMPGCR